MTDRALTRAEAVVVRSLLACDLAPERQRILASGLPRTTYQDAKRRLYSEGLLQDRYVPHPALVGCRRVRFEVARPFAEQLAETAERWEADPRSVLVWSGAQSVLGVFFDRGEDVSRPTRSSPNGELAATIRPLVLEVDPGQYSLPVFFDLEGALSGLTGSPPTPGYPRGLGGPGPEIGRPRLRWDPRHRPEVVRGLLLRPFADDPGGRAPHLLGPASLPRSMRQLVLSGWVQWRVMPKLPSLPSYQGRAVQSLALVAGKLLPDARPSDLFSTLVALLGIRPFLFATDASSVLIGTLVADAPTAPSGTPTPRSSTLEVLRGYLGQIELVREPLSSLRVPVDHRYDRLWTETSGPS